VVLLVRDGGGVFTIVFRCHFFCLHQFVVVSQITRGVGVFLGSCQQFVMLCFGFQSVCSCYLSCR
jgi:hypothetical protein